MINDDDDNNELVLIISVPLPFGTRHDMAIEVIKEIGRHISTVTDDSGKTVFSLHCLSIARFFTEHCGC